MRGAGIWPSGGTEKLAVRIGIVALRASLNSRPAGTRTALGALTEPVRHRYPVAPHIELGRILVPKAWVAEQLGAGSHLHENFLIEYYWPTFWEAMSATTLGVLGALAPKTFWGGNLMNGSEHYERPSIVYEIFFIMQAPRVGEIAEQITNILVLASAEAS
ncbi:hypothetical protein P691DRAFT_791349 [Macrolepiota fuliginosa MF-IS2]|uniref:Uncharacterized protein n=1 Tax=Macrolepiota fuliginosa MF-IS2 TaxID=1400762 RepID=A0A9P6C4Y5_9AGAR|nr:hypothetical protein P691DRAFT_791349 [Macrolepiota fuliginosa MF-IS2]